MFAPCTRPGSRHHTQAHHNFLCAGQEGSEKTLIGGSHLGACFLLVWTPQSRMITRRLCWQSWQQPDSGLAVLQEERTLGYSQIQKIKVNAWKSLTHKHFKIMTKLIGKTGIFKRLVHTSA